MNTGSARASAPSVDELVTRSLDISHFVRESSRNKQNSHDRSRQKLFRVFVEPVFFVFCSRLSMVAMNMVLMLYCALSPRLGRVAARQGGY